MCECVGCVCGCVCECVGMDVSVCGCVCECLWVYVCECVWVCVCVRVWVYVCEGVWVCVCVGVFVCVGLSPRSCFSSLYLLTSKIKCYCEAVGNPYLWPKFCKSNFAAVLIGIW